MVNGKLKNISPISESSYQQPMITKNLEEACVIVKGAQSLETGLCLVPSLNKLLNFGKWEQKYLVHRAVKIINKACKCLDTCTFNTFMTIAVTTCKLCCSLTSVSWSLVLH